jgi:hypothetical protein
MVLISQFVYYLLSLAVMKNIAVKSYAQSIAAKAHQIAVKAVQRNCCRISPKILIRELPRENCCQITTKYCCESCPENKHGTIPGKTKAAKTADGTNAFSITATE